MTSQHPEDQGVLMYSLESASQALNLPQSTIRDMERKGQFPAAVRIGRRLQWKAKDIQGWVSSLSPQAVKGGQ